jgi:hypothetical protein
MYAVAAHPGPGLAALQRLQTRLEKRMEALQRVNLAGYDWPKFQSLLMQWMSAPTPNAKDPQMPDRPGGKK